MCQSGRFVQLDGESDDTQCAEFGIETWMIADSTQPARRLMFGMCRRHDVELWRQSRERPPLPPYFLARLMEVGRP